MFPCKISNDWIFTRWHNIIPRAPWLRGPLGTCLTCLNGWSGPVCICLPCVVGPYHRKRSSSSVQTLYEEIKRMDYLPDNAPAFPSLVAQGVERLFRSITLLNSIRRMFFVICHQRPNGHTNSGLEPMIMFSPSRMLKTLSRATCTSSRWILTLS